ncbi:MAG: ArsR/SmtB family transcription factor [Terriglobales bacterium]
MKNLREAENIFKGLADTTRLRIINLLLHGELCVCDIQRVLGASQPNVSRHLNYLKNSGLVLDRRNGPRMFYRLSQENGAVHKRLFPFLRDIFRTSDVLVEDAKKLRTAIAAGACNASEWRPYSALSERTAGRAS